MSKDYFKPIEYNKPKEVDKKKKYFPSRAEWTPTIKYIWEEIHKIEGGCSSFRRGAMVVKDNLPAVVTLLRFSDNPTERELKSLYVVLPQDFGLAGEHFVEKLKALLEEKRK